MIRRMKKTGGFFMRTKNFVKRMTAALLALALCVTMAETTSFAKAKAKPKLSDTTLTMWTNLLHLYEKGRRKSHVEKL